jgi:hypothetical protein
VELDRGDPRARFVHSNERREDTNQGAHRHDRIGDGERTVGWHGVTAEGEGVTGAEVGAEGGNAERYGDVGRLSGSDGCHETDERQPATRDEQPLVPGAVVHRHHRLQGDREDAEPTLRIPR